MKAKTFFKLFLSLCLFLALAWLLYVGWGMLSEKISIVRNYRVSEQQGKSLEFGNQLKEKTERLALQGARIKSAFIQNEGILSFIERLEISAANNGLTILIDKVEQGSPEPLPSGAHQVSLVTFVIRLDGTYENISRFARELQSYEQELAVEQTALNRSGDSLNTYVARMTLIGNGISQ